MGSVLSHSSSHLRLVFFFRIVLSTSFDKRPPHILEHLVGLVGGKFVALDLCAQANPQRVQRVEGCIVGVVGCALFPVLPHGHIVTMGFVCPRGTRGEQETGEKDSYQHGRTLTESSPHVKRTPQVVAPSSLQAASLPARDSPEAEPQARAVCERARAA